MSAAARTAPAASRPPRARRRARLVEHRPFLVALAVGLALRVLVQVAFMPAFVFSDGPTYLAVVDHLRPAADRPVGYVLLLLLPASLLARDVLLVAVVQHLLGLVTAVVLYALLRRWCVGRWVGMLATLPVLMDTLQLTLEHSVLSDTLFELLVVCGLARLCWRRRLAPGGALTAGLLLGTAATVRLVGEHLVAVGVLAALLLAGQGWRRRTAAAVAVLAGFAVPVAAYATWYHEVRGPFTLAQFTGKALYLRSTTFVDCSAISVPDYERVLCPTQPPGSRRDPTYYGFHDPRTIPELSPPPGTSQDQAMREFALATFRAQPLDYLRVVARDFALNFDWVRQDRFEYETAAKWSFRYYLTVRPTTWTGPAYAAHGGRQLHVVRPLGDALADYQSVGYLPGPLLACCLLVGLAAVLGLGRARGSGLRSVTLSLLLAGVGLLLVPAVTAEFVWRYQLPALALLPAAAALGYTALRGAGPGPEDPSGPGGTVATASTD